MGVTRSLELEKMTTVIRTGPEIKGWGVDFVGCRILYFDSPFAGIAAMGAGVAIGTGVAALDAPVEPDKGTPVVAVERGSKGFMAFPFGFASSCAFANLNLAGSGVSTFSLDSFDEDSTGGDGRDCSCGRDGESAGV